jgi:hypothetical protein
MAKLDPRADPLSEPPQGKDDFSVDRVAVPKNTKPARAEEPLELESKVVPVGDADGENEDEHEDAETTPFVPPGKITSQDPRYEPLEKLLDANDWKKIGAELGPMTDIGKLPPNLGLVAALAHNENAKDGDPEAVATAIRCMAGLLGVPEDSPIARVLARRMLRKNPVRIRDRQAPPARTSLLIVLATLVIGGGVGWLASIGSWRGILNLLHM